MPGTIVPKTKERLKQLLADVSAGGFLISKVLSFNLNFSFLKWISLLLISSNYSIVLMRLMDPFQIIFSQKKILECSFGNGNQIC